MIKNRYVWLLVLVIAVAFAAAPALAVKKAEKKNPAPAPAASAPAPAGTKDPIPLNNGFYVYDGDKLTELQKPEYKDTKYDKKEYLGFVDDSPAWKAFKPNAMLVLYDPRIDDPAKLRFQTMRFEGIRHNQGSTFKTKKYHLNMWITDNDVPFKFRESSDKPGVWIFTPARALEPGRYVAYWGKNLGVAAKDKVPHAFIFEIKK